MANAVKIVFLDAATIGYVDNLSEISRLGDYTSHDITPPALRIERIKGHHVVITNKVIIDHHVMEACPDLQLICVVATGMNNIDLEEAAKRKVAVKNVAGYSTESVAQCTFSMLFYLMNASGYYDRYVKSGLYAESAVFTHLGREFCELNGKRFGIIGMGAIGRRVADIACAFGAKVVYYSTSGKNLENTGYPHMPLEELLQTADVVSIHCPLNDRTRNLLTESRLRLMKPAAYLLNMGRGGIVDEAALARMIDDDAVAGAGLDVLTSEPIAAASPLLKVRRPEKLFITPHIAWAGREARRLLVTRTAQNIKNFFNL